MVCAVLCSHLCNDNYHRFSIYRFYTYAYVLWNTYIHYVYTIIIYAHIINIQPQLPEVESVLWNYKSILCGCWSIVCILYGVFSAAVFRYIVDEQTFVRARACSSHSSRAPLFKDHSRTLSTTLLIHIVHKVSFFGNTQFPAHGPDEGMTTCVRTHNIIMLPIWGFCMCVWWWYGTEPRASGYVYRTNSRHQRALRWPLKCLCQSLICAWMFSCVCAQACANKRHWKVSPFNATHSSLAHTQGCDGFTAQNVICELAQSTRVYKYPDLFDHIKQFCCSQCVRTLMITTTVRAVSPPTRTRSLAMIYLRAHALCLDTAQPWSRSTVYKYIKSYILRVLVVCMY